MKSVLLIGHISVDIRKGRMLAGGPPRYQYPILYNFGYSIHIITSCRSDNSFLDLDNARIDNIDADDNTTFAFSIDEDEQMLDNRVLRLVKRANDLNNIEDLLADSYDIVIISPIANEINRDTMELIVSRARTSYLDIQGIARVIERGIVSHNLKTNDFNWALRTFDVIKCSKSEIVNIEVGNPNKSKLVITNSGNDIEIISDNEICVISSSPVDEIVDDTGSGDIFLAALAGYSELYNFEMAISKADKLARESLSILGIPTIEQINL